MKRIFLYITAILAFAFGTRAADGDLFPYPKPSDDMTGLTERCDFLVSKFWNHCDFKGAMSKMDKFNNTFGDWVSFMPYASADTVHSAINRVIKQVEKSGPQTLALARMAQNWSHCDTAQFYSDEVFLPFAKAAANHKKVPAEDRKYFATQVQIMENTQVGQPVGNLDYVTLDGQKGSLNDIHTQMIVLFFNENDCSDCSMSRIHLSADINATALIKAGILTVLCITPGEPTPEWKAEAAGYPKEWIIGASTSADQYFSMREKPSIYLMDSRHKLLVKDANINGLINTLTLLRQNAGI